MKNTVGKISKVFKASFLIYPITFAVALFLGTVIGIDSGWAMPAMNRHEIMYGWDAIISYIIVIVMKFSIIYALILIFQASYIIIRLIVKIKNTLKFN